MSSNTGVVMSQRDQINYASPSHYMFCEEDGKWYVFGPMPLFKAVIEAVGKYRANHEPCIFGDAVSLIGIESILAVRQRPDFPVSLTLEAPQTLARAILPRSGAH